MRFRSTFCYLLLFYFCGCSREEKEHLAVHENWLALRSTGRLKSSSVCASYDRFGMTLLHRAAIFGDTNILSEVIRICDEIDRESERSGMTALILAAQEGNVEAVRVLLTANANVNHRSTGNFTALMAAVSSAGLRFVEPPQENEMRSFMSRGSTRDDFVKVVQILCAYGAIKDIRNSEGKTAIDIAREDGLHEVVEALDINLTAQPNKE